jgi:hypothetical protein
VLNEMLLKKIKQPLKTFRLTLLSVLENGSVWAGKQKSRCAPVCNISTAKPSMKIGTANAICWNSLGQFSVKVLV